jgi:TRAP-type C4-dicarboxylate transport system permease small subunit
VRVLLSLVARWCGYGGALSLAAMMLITVADVSSRALFNKPITGAYDLVQLFLVGTVFLSVPDVFWRGENIVIDLVDHIGRPVGVAWLKALASVTALIFLAVLAWRMVPPALDSVTFREVSLDLSIPMWVYWSLMLLGIVLALPIAAWALIGCVRRLPGGRDAP